MDSQGYDPVTMIDQEHGTKPKLGYVNITVASLYSRFALTFQVRRTTSLQLVKDTFGKCADWTLSALRYLYNSCVVSDEDTPNKVRDGYHLRAASGRKTDRFQLRMKNGDGVHVLAEAQFNHECFASRAE